MWVLRKVPLLGIVALRKESVDRNLWWGVRKAVGSLSLSARRAWIEIWSAVLTELLILVALRKESVDRNRRTIKCAIARIKVALRKESVDRNFRLLFEKHVFISRSPQGERG